MSDKQTIVGKIEDKVVKESKNPKAPAGHINVNGQRITIWEQEHFDSLELGNEYEFNCSVKPNTYEGKTYQNYSMIDALPVAEKEVSDLVLVGHKVLVDDNVKDLILPTEVIEYIKELTD